MAHTFRCFTKSAIHLFTALSLVAPSVSLAQRAPQGPQTPQSAQADLQAAGGLLLKTEEMMRKTRQELSELTDSNGNVRNSSNQKRADELRQRLQILSSVANDLARFVGRHGGEFEVAFVVDPKKGPSEDNIKSARISLPPSALSEVDLEASAKQTSRVHALVNKAGGAALHFSNQYFAYSVATGLIAMSQLQFADTSNPNALELWIQQTTDVMGAAGFMIFMAANHKVIHMLNRVRSGVLPRTMIPYLGMAAGSLAQSYFHDLWADKDLWKCLRSYYDPKAQRDPASCDKAKRTWIAGQHARILQYAPSVISMLGSAAIAGAIRSALIKSGGAEAIKRGYMHVAAKGVNLFSKAQWARRGAALVAGGLPGIAVTVGDFVLFIALDAQVLHEPINHAWQNFRMNHFDPQAFLDKRLGLHSEVLFPKENTYQLIDNAFDVEATNLRSAHEYFMETLERMSKTGWQRPPETRSCTPKEIAEGIESGELKPLTELWFWQRLTQRKKSQQQLRCEVFSRPADLLQRYADVNREWRNILLNNYSIGQSNWLMMVDRFSTVYEAAYLLAKHLARLKFEMVENGRTERPDLSREALAKVIRHPLTGDESNDDHVEPVHEKVLPNTAIPTPELVDYVIASFACGPSPSASIAGMKPANIKIPFGSSPRFLPPKITNKKIYPICVVDPYKKNTRNPFDGIFLDFTNGGRTYKSLADFVFDNLDPALYQKIGINFSFENWWTQNIRDPIAPIWAQYETKYDKFIMDSFVPVLFDRSSKTQNAKKPYQVANGIFLSLEYELRNYLRALFSIYSAAVSQSGDADGRKAYFRTIVNNVIEQLKEIDAAMLVSGEYLDILYGTEEALETLFLLVETELIANEGPNAEFQLEMTAELRNLISSLHQEIVQYASTFHALRFADGSSARDLVKKLNSENGSNGNKRPVTLPHMRHGN